MLARVPPMTSENRIKPTVLKIITHIILVANSIEIIDTMATKEIQNKYDITRYLHLLNDTKMNFHKSH